MMNMKVFLLALCVAACSTARLQKRATCGLDSLMTTTQQQAITAEHNDKRALENSEAELQLEWLDDLAAKAQEWADQCVWEHGMTKGCDGKAVGQNMYAVIGGDHMPEANMASVVQAWYQEKPDYDRQTYKCVEGKMCGHYKQVVWDKTQYVGCGIKQCPTVQVGSGGATWTNAVIVVCDYSPAGNIQGVPVYAEGLPCSQCEKNVMYGYKCSNNLCKSCKPVEDDSCTCTQKNCQNGSTWNADECSCDCPVGFSGRECEVPCADVYPGACPTWKGAGYCTMDAYDKFMSDNCATTCQKRGCA